MILTREKAEMKGRRYVTEGRLKVLSIREHRIDAVCRGSGWLGYSEAAWDRSIAAAKDLLAHPAIRLAARDLSTALMLKGAIRGDEVARIVDEAAGGGRFRAGEDFAFGLPSPGFDEGSVDG